MTSTRSSSSSWPARGEAGSASQIRVQCFEEVLLVGVHVLLDRTLARPGRVEIQRDPPVVVAFAQNAEERREVHASGSKALVEIDPVVFLFAGCRPFPAAGGAVFGLRVLEMDCRDPRVVVAK